ncbi:LacI family DNA-binding transcriptional regulator [Pelagicoccus mobilis]|uniref:LacI family DNA-binding transcriptional regulator n=1 Tax=Pelagicoccus mobilis TaxID=415221 RepID=A0A934RT84_9BACT|nr:LacI family DNA-binding transcriptional regulator [Pelagicoccus mobilis]MBK1876013.1 LacI family DNA-binding transcriptional regulator [Pelagicoccus mobilis]
MKKKVQRPTVRTIAEVCGVSRTTVSWALNGKPGVSDEMREKILKTAAECDYKVDPKVAQVMAGIAKDDTRRAMTQIAIVSAKEVKAAPPWKGNDLLNRFYRGFERRIEELGVGLNSFWLAEEGMSNKRLSDILKARGVEGVVLLFEYGSEQPDFDFDISEFSVASICKFIKTLKIDAADVDIHNCMCIAMEKAKEFGYKRPGLAVKRATSARGNHTWESAFLYEQRMFMKKNRIPVFVGEEEEMLGLLDWYERYQPDVIIGHEPPSLSHLRKNGIRVPEDVGYIALEEHDPAWNISCVNVHPRMIASAAVDLVLERMRDGVKGEPEIPKTVLIDGHWVDGYTLRKQGR